MMVFVYAVLVFLVLRFCVTLFNFLSNPKLGYYGKHFTEKVSVVVLSSAREPDIDSLLLSIDQQDYKNIEVMVQQGDSVTELIDRTTGKYLLFISPGITLHYGLINNLIYRAKVFSLTALSLIPTYKASGFLAQCIYPLSDFLLLNLLPLRLVRLSNHPAFAAGSNECMFFDAARYKEHKWYEKLNHKLPEATEIVKLVKQRQLKAEVLLANRFIQYKVDLKDVKGFAQGLLMNFSNSNLVAFIYLLLVIVGPVTLLFVFNPVRALLPFGLIFLSRIMIAFLTSQNPFRNVLLHPIQMALLFVLMIRGIWERIMVSIKIKK